jgi:hypothetical protein
LGGVTTQAIEVELRDRALTVMPGVIDEAARQLFTVGYCMELAVALHRVTGWPVIAAGHWGDDGELVPGAHYGVAVGGDDERVLDVEGVHDRWDWSGRWGIDGASGIVAPPVLADDDQLSPGVIDAFARALLAAVVGDGVHGRVGGE